VKYLLFCNLPYSFSILKPLEEEILLRGFEYLWYIPPSIENNFPYKESNYTTSFTDLIDYASDFIFVPGNEVPHFLHGVKIQIFHGLAGEKKGHFRIRDYFDLYLTPGPYFTNRFKALSLKHNNFDVIQTGWSKLDKLYQKNDSIIETKKRLLREHNTKKILLYSPTFSPSLTSANQLKETIHRLSLNKDILIIIKFHDKMNINIIDEYKKILSKNIIISEEKDITLLLQVSDLMISDTSSVVYEFILLNKPVITFQSKSDNISWSNFLSILGMENDILRTLEGQDNFKNNRQEITSQYHPYDDAQSGSRMIQASLDYIKENPIPLKRKISLLRKFKIYKQYKILNYQSYKQLFNP